MIESVQFTNFKALRAATLPLQQFTLIVGPNGSGKSTALQALQAVGKNQPLADFEAVVAAGVEQPHQATIEVTISWGPPLRGASATWRWLSYRHPSCTFQFRFDEAPDDIKTMLRDDLSSIRVYSLDAGAAAGRAQLTPSATMGEDGSNLAVVIDRLRDQEPERFEALNSELQRWLPEFDRVLFDTPAQGARMLALRMRDGQRKIPAAGLSQGTLIALSILTLAYLPNPPAIMCFEEPDRGIHPRLLRDVRDALYRLSYPEGAGEKRKPVQVIATTHSPYLLDLYKDHPEEIVIAQKVGQQVQFERLSDRDDLDEILRDAHLGDVWYSGILGGVPSHP